VSHIYDVAIIGAGIVGLATARALAEQLRGIDLVVVDKEPQVAMHQTGHNSGVLHSGLYYRPGSLKARLCVDGQRRMGEFCEAHDIPLRRSGKVVVAVEAAEIARLDELERRGHANGLRDLMRLDPSELRELEPHVTGVAALHVPESGVTDFGLVADAMAKSLPATIRLGSAVEGIVAKGEVTTLITSTGSVAARLVVNCAGLHADRVAAMAGVDPPARIVPFRGEYFVLSESAQQLVRALVYPVPDPRFPFLGVHFTRGIDGFVEVGPNAVPAFGREHYRGAAASWSDTADTVRYAGARRLARRYWRTGALELWRSTHRAAYAREARRLVPALKAADLAPGGAGVRAQAVARDGSLVDDFLVVDGPGSVHVLNAPSPAATASLTIGHHIAERVVGQLR